MVHKVFDLWSADVRFDGLFVIANVGSFLCGLSHFRKTNRRSRVSYVFVVITALDAALRRLIQVGEILLPSASVCNFVVLVSCIFCLGQFKIAFRYPSLNLFVWVRLNLRLDYFDVLGNFYSWLLFVFLASVMLCGVIILSSWVLPGWFFSAVVRVPAFFDGMSTGPVVFLPNLRWDSQLSFPSHCRFCVVAFFVVVTLPRHYSVSFTWLAFICGAMFSIYVRFTSLGLVRAASTRLLKFWADHFCCSLRISFCSHTVPDTRLFYFCFCFISLFCMLRDLTSLSSSVFWFHHGFLVAFRHVAPRLFTLRCCLRYSCVRWDRCRWVP